MKFGRILNVSLKYLFVLCIADIILSCPLLLKFPEWEPLTVKERADSSEIVISGVIMRTFKDIRTQENTYVAKVKILDVFKGGKLLVNDVKFSRRDRRIFNVSNFGDIKDCRADVQEGRVYYIFLDIYQGNLSARYDDIFGAAVEYSAENEREVHEATGWKVWTEWTSCSKMCNTGVQSKSRFCRWQNDTCEGTRTEERKCNIFSCKGKKNILKILGILKLPHRGTDNGNTQPSYNTQSSTQLYTPLSSVFKRRKFPRQFSIILTVKVNEHGHGVLFSVNDLSGWQIMSVQYGEVVTFSYSTHSTSRDRVSIEFPVTIDDNKWHYLAFSITQNSIVLFYDCDFVFTRPFVRSKKSFVIDNMILSLGNYFGPFGRKFLGEIQQFIITTSEHDAKLQCYEQSHDVDGTMSDGQDTSQTTMIPTSVYTTFKSTSFPLTRTTSSSTTTLSTTILHFIVPSAADQGSWSQWSSCSVSCGKGRQTRTFACGNGNAYNCTSKHNSPKKQTRLCFHGYCTDSINCTMECYNEGICYGNRCICKHGYYGQQCENAICTGGCLNGGTCVFPNKCACPLEYTGRNCEDPVCSPPCSNGGHCIRPGDCACPYGYLQPDCRPYCRQLCLNGGRCVRNNKCKCKKGYGGKNCSRVTCRNGCQNGGRCVAPNKCLCRSGYIGKRCQKAFCLPVCRNGGRCVQPYLCACKNGFTGFYCDQFHCKKPCMNGGKCIGPNTCQCLAGFSGKTCRRVHCQTLCLNGGRCSLRNGNKCRCPVGFKGKHCEKRICHYQKFSVPYERTARQMIREEYLTRCSSWRWKMCVRTRIKYKLVKRKSLRTEYRCV